MPGARDRIPHASSRLVTAVLSTIIDAGGGAILDGNFNTVRHMTPVREFVAARNVRTAEVCLWGDHEALRRRFVLRADPPLTDDLRSYFEQVLYRPRVSVLSPPALIEHVDTTDLATLDERYPALLTALRGAAGQAEPRLRDA